MRKAIASMVDSTAVTTMTIKARMIERSMAPCKSPTVEGSISFAHQWKLNPRKGKRVPPRSRHR